MKVSIQIKILNTKNYYEYLKRDSMFIKELNRGETNFVKFDEFVKNKYTLKIGDRVNKALENVENITNLLNVLK
ncbi:MAG: hypothetical protein E7159_03015 [Firmicutes bacterium]|nr:hypothetical protein [Bacillota bacterium]